MGRKIAIVGTGIAGLATAHALHRCHDITVFEAGPTPGGHATTIAVDTPAGSVDGDTGFIVFNDRNYPRFERSWPTCASPGSPAT
jgi:predicted NAD/FAD-binding protein